VSTISSRSHCGIPAGLKILVTGRPLTILYFIGLGTINLSANFFYGEVRKPYSIK